MLEKRFIAVPSQPFTANGTANGIVTVSNTALFKVKQEVILSADTLPNLDNIEVKQVISPTQLVVGPKAGNIQTYVDISAYTVVRNSAIFANQQLRPKITADDFERAVYEEEPTVAKRVVLVDKFGNKYETDNPLPVVLSNGSINIGTVTAELEVQLDHRDNQPNPGDVHDSVRVGDGTDTLEINTDGSIKTVQLFTKPFDSITATYPSPAQEVYMSRVGGVLGTIQEVITINYTDASKRFMLNVARV